MPKPIQGEAAVGAVNGLRHYVDSSSMPTSEPYKLIFTNARVLGAPMTDAAPTVEPAFSLDDDWVRHATWEAMVGKVREVQIKRGMLWEKDKYYLTVKAGMMHSTAIRLVADDVEAVKGLVAATPCAPRVKIE